MLFDLISTIEVTVGAAIVVAVLALGLSATTKGRVAFVLAGGAWFALVVVLGAAGALHYGWGLGTPGLGIAVLLPVMLLSSAAAALPSFRQALDRVPLALLIGINGVRILGVSFVLLYAMNRLPAPFAPAAGWGDIAVGLAAGPIAWLASHPGPRTRPAVLAWNVLGLLDLITAVSLGAASSPGPIRLFFGTPDSSLMTSLPWLIIPGFLVPALAATHLAIFYRLRRERLAGDGAECGRTVPA